MFCSTQDFLSDDLNLWCLLQVAGVENAGADPLHAMAMDHAKYRDALKNHLVIRGVLDALCMQEWNVTCEVRFPTSMALSVHRSK
jgi:hypothetical protein